MWRSYNALVFFVLILGETAWGWNWSGGVGDLITYDCIFLVNLTSTVHDLFLWVMIACLVIFWPCQLDCHSTRPYTCSSSIFWLLVNLTAVVHDFFAERTFAQAVFFGIVVNLTATVHDFICGAWVGVLLFFVLVNLTATQCQCQAYSLVLSTSIYTGHFWPCQLDCSAWPYACSSSNLWAGQLDRYSEWFFRGAWVCVPCYFLALLTWLPQCQA